MDYNYQAIAFKSMLSCHGKGGGRRLYVHCPNERVQPLPLSVSRTLIAKRRILPVSPKSAVLKEWLSQQNLKKP